MSNVLFWAVVIVGAGLVGWFDPTLMVVVVLPEMIA